MKRPVIMLFHERAKEAMLAASIASVLILSYLCIAYLHQASRSPEQFRSTVSLILFLFFIPLLLGWMRFGLWAAAIFMPIASAFAVLAAWVIQLTPFLIFVPAQAGLCLLLFYLDERKKNEVVVREVDIEKVVNEKNDLEIAFREKGTSISVLFDKYASYYNLRNLANDFSTTLNLAELSRMITAKTAELIPRGDACLLFFADQETGALTLVASQSLNEEKANPPKTGDLFDFWVLRNRQSLILTDTEKDFRFDLKRSSGYDYVRSLIASPLLYEGHVGGTLRLISREPGTFGTEDLRILDAIATLASSAVSNAILFQKTEELAIRDSLTGLYVQRYFRERLQEEHRRSLLTDSPLALLMCDLDHFKECNDRYGHGVGDLVLSETAKILIQNAPHSIVARYGGEEFSILLPKAGISEGRTVAESIRRALTEMQLVIRREALQISISIGVAVMPEDTRDPEELIRIADERLYEAKKKGRNRVC